MAQIQLRDGATVEVPDGLDPAAMEDYGNRAQAAYDAAHSSPSSQPQGLLQRAFPREQYPGVNAALDWLNQTPAEAAPGVDRALGGYPSAIASSINKATGGYAGQAGNFAANIAADVATAPWDAPASVTNAITHTAQRYGYGVGEPDLPLAAPLFKEAFGVAPPTSKLGQQVETLADLVVGNKAAGAKLLPAIVSGATQDVVQNVGGAVVGNVANAVDPRLREIGETFGAVLPGYAPKETIGSWLFNRQRPPNAGDVYDRTQNLGLATGNPDLTPTAGMVGGPLVSSVERSGAAFPVLNIPVKAAQGKVANAVEGGVRSAAEAVAPMREGPLPQGAFGPGAPVKTLPDTTPGAPGALLQQGAQDELTQRWNDAKSAIDQTEAAASLTNLRDASGNPVLVKGPQLQSLFDSLDGLTSQTVNGQAIPVSVGSGGDAANSAAARLRSALTPQDPVLDRNLNAVLNSTNYQLANHNVPASVKPALYSQARNIQNQIDANMGVSFEALRRLKSEIGSSIDQGSVDSYTGNQITGAMTDALQQHLDAVDPALGQRYKAANDQYRAAMKYRQDLTGPGVVNAVGTPQGPGRYANPPGQTDLTNRVAGFLRNPERAGILPQTPGWRDAVAALVSRLGQNNGQFDPKTFLQQWGDAKLGGGPGSTLQGRALFTKPSPEAAWLLDHATDVARALERGPASHGGENNLAGPLATTAIAEHVMGTHGLGSSILGGLATTFGLERPGMIRALAGRPAPYFQQTSPLPAILAIAQAQGRNQGY